MKQHPLPLHLVRGLLALMCSATLCVLSAHAAAESVVPASSGIPYVSGGVGTESIDRLNVLATNFNLKLVFSAKSGEYLSGVKVDIASTTGQALVAASADGPWFLVKLPAGKYRVGATFNGNAITREITVETAGLKTVDYQWDAR